MRDIVVTGSATVASSLAVIDASDLNSFWQALLSAKYDATSKTLLVDGGFDPLMKNCSTIYVRNCHQKLVDLLLAISSTSGQAARGARKQLLGMNYRIQMSGTW
ncbi:hypothetical protein WJX84_003420 [Apatococcus fuscideae]|uniref:Uncharacterized protein n=1 Tax=Apatococcus fuscideae TaxID=2026836 RepID=A0AAW1TH24_9CHLO